MKTFKVSRIYSETTVRYKVYPEGIEDLGTIKATNKDEAIHLIIRAYDDQNYFPHENGSIADCDGNVIFLSGDDSADFADYVYIAEEL
jgi:hypothetical protein